ncbi:hypothetical protein [Pseudoalteromonas sp. JC28]|uniref:hypothetical protein n=1 Tax=Pseudoalteromonas sp. JC28 TaxID=2267617 RepID=UPI001571BFEA|nr:hypothetical protein [Pseudoalteromonas sp. JC28]
MEIMENNELTEDFKVKVAEIFRRTIERCLDNKRRVLQKDFSALVGGFKQDQYNEDKLNQLKYEYNRIIKNKVDEKQKQKKKFTPDNDSLLAKNNKELVEEVKYTFKL